MNMEFISFQKALSLTLDRIRPLDSIVVPVAESAGFTSSEALCAKVDSPSADASLKDGYAVHSEDVASASTEKPVLLKVSGVAAAGQNQAFSVKPKHAVRLLTGAKIPSGANAVVAGEFTEEIDEVVRIMAHAEPGRNILPRGADVAAGEALLPAGSVLTPGSAGLLAAGGLDRIRVYRQPGIALLATGDEIRLPGEPLATGEIYASNMITLDAWCRRNGWQTTLSIVPDNATTLGDRLLWALDDHDAIVTSGGAWTSDRDLLAKVLADLGWEKIYHRVRLGPGKAVGFGVLKGRPVFILPGGPPSNLIAFLLLALPGLARLSGTDTPPIRKIEAILKTTVTGQIDWTQAIFGIFEKNSKQIAFNPKKNRSRLKGIGTAEGILMIPEGETRIEAGEKVTVRLLT